MVFQLIYTKPKFEGIICNLKLSFNFVFPKN